MPTSSTVSAPSSAALTKIIEQEGLCNLFVSLKAIVLENASTEIRQGGLLCNASSLECIATLLNSCEIEAQRL